MAVEWISRGECARPAGGQRNVGNEVLPRRNALPHFGRESVLAGCAILERRLPLPVDLAQLVFTSPRR
jgi:hypothetical protein